MFINSICSPAIIYLAFSLTHILIDMFTQRYNTALIRFVIMIVFTILLNILCERGLNIISWFLVFIPFIMMTFTSSILFMMFGNAFIDKITKSDDIKYSIKDYV